MTLLSFLLVAACSGAASLSGPENPEDGSPSVASVQMTPSNVAVHVGDRTNLSLEVTTSDGEPFEREGEWTVRDTSVVVVKGQGAQRQAEGRSEGVTHVIGTVDGVADSAEVRVGGQAGSPDPTVASVDLSPSEVTVQEGGSADVGLTVTSTDGASLDRSGSWQVDGSDVVRVDGTGSTRQVVGLAIGSARVIATVDGVADTTAVEVVSEADPADAEPAVVFDPDKYSSTRELMDDPYGVFAEAEIGGDYNLDTSVGYPGGSQSMRYDWVDQGAGNPIGIGRTIPLPSNADEVWVEAYVRWSTNFMNDIPLDSNDGDPSTDVAAHKFLFLAANCVTDCNASWEISDGTNVYRWALLWPAATRNPPSGPISAETPAIVESDVATDGPQIIKGINHDVSQHFDAQWHRLRVHIRHDPGAYEVWIDGEKIVDLADEGFPDFTVRPEVATTALLLGRNKDDGNESGTESLWWGKVSVWTSSPGW